MLNLTIKRWFKEVFGFVTKEVFGFVTKEELSPKAREIATLNHMQEHVDHLKAHAKYLGFLDKGFNEQVKTRQTRRVSKGTNKALKKRAKKGTPRNRTIKKTTRLLAK